MGANVEGLEPKVRLKTLSNCALSADLKLPGTWSSKTQFGSCSGWGFEVFSIDTSSKAAGFGLFAIGLIRMVMAGGDSESVTVRCRAERESGESSFEELRADVEEP